MATLRDLKGRIGSVSSSEKITGAMKMISSAKMTKAMREIKRLQPYRNQLDTIIGHLLAADTTCSSPLATPHASTNHITVVVAGSDDGLCGAYNANIGKELDAHVSNLLATHPQAQIKVLTIGGKMFKTAKRLLSSRATVEAAPDVTSKSTNEAVKQFAQHLESSYLDGSTDRIDFIYMGFISTSRQRIQCLPLLPMTPNANSQEGTHGEQLYIFEPSAEAIFASALPLMLLSNVQEAFCENRASEQAARVMAMQSANDNATKLLDQLRLDYNKLRQQSITSELLDIIGGQSAN